MTDRRSRAGIACCLSLAFASLSPGPFATPAAAAEAADALYPSRPIHIVVPQAAGGAVDIVTRMLADRIAAALNCTVVVENKPGANGVIGTQAVKDAAPDGYTLLAASSSTHAMAPHTMRQIPYDALNDFVPIVNVAYTIKVVMVSPALPVRTLAEFIAYARDRPGVLNYGSTGFGSSTHLDVELFAADTGLRLVHVPYRSAPQHNQALVNNEVQLVIGSLTTALGLLQSGKLRALAIVSDRRTPLLPDVPTIEEAGLRGFDVRTWIGLVAPSGTPERIVETLNRTVNDALREPSVQRWIGALGLGLIGGTPVQFERQLRSDYAHWGEVVTRLGLLPE
jgi:tripartite-type tricarboxylate transporter receptor subunit TctC